MILKNENKLLSEILVKGYRNSFDKINDWLIEIKNNLDKVFNLIYLIWFPIYCCKNLNKFKCSLIF